VTENEFAVSSSSTHRVVILPLEDTGMMHDRVTGNFFFLLKKHYHGKHLSRRIISVCLVTNL